MLWKTGERYLHKKCHPTCTRIIYLPKTIPFGISLISWDSCMRWHSSGLEIWNDLDCLRSLINLLMNTIISFIKGIHLSKKGTFNLSASLASSFSNPMSITRNLLFCLPHNRMVHCMSLNQQIPHLYNSYCFVILQAVPYFFGLILLECVLLFCQGKPLPRLNDSYTSLANGLLSILHRFVYHNLVQHLLSKQYCWALASSE